MKIWLFIILSCFFVEIFWPIKTFATSKIVLNCENVLLLPDEVIEKTSKKIVSVALEQIIKKNSVHYVQKNSLFLLDLIFKNSIKFLVSDTNEDPKLTLLWSDNLSPTIVSITLSKEFVKKAAKLFDPVDYTSISQQIPEEIETDLSKITLTLIDYFALKKTLEAPEKTSFVKEKNKLEQEMQLKQTQFEPSIIHLGKQTKLTRLASLLGFSGLNKLIADQAITLNHNGGIKILSKRKLYDSITPQLNYYPFSTPNSPSFIQFLSQTELEIYLGEFALYVDLCFRAGYPVSFLTKIHLRFGEIFSEYLKRSGHSPVLK